MIQVVDEETDDMDPGDGARDESSPSGQLENEQLDDSSTIAGLKQLSGTLGTCSGSSASLPPPQDNFDQGPSKKC